MAFPNYYAILNVPNNASHEEIKAAYKKESLKSHPDGLKNVEPTEMERAEKNFQAVADAYFILSDETRRRQYDQDVANMPGGVADANAIFADVFDELLRREVDHIQPCWAWAGTISGAVLGFIIADFPGAVAGATACNTLGAIRDAKGKSVAEVYFDLNRHQKYEIIRTLMMKVLVAAI